MTNSPLLWGAGLACALGGAIAGNALGSTPVADRSAIAMFYQEHATASDGSQDAHALPDHYPLVTRSGVVPVTELSERGLFSQRRYQPVFAAIAEADYAPIQEASYAGFEDPELPIRRAIDGEDAAPETSEMPTTAVDGAIAATGQARFVHGGTTIALR